MQPSGNFIRMIVKFTTGMKFCHNHFNSRYFFLFMDTYRNSAPVIRHTDTVIRVNDHLNLAAKTSHGFIDTVVHNLVNQVVKSGNIDIAYIHGWSLTNGFQPLKHFNIVFGIIICVVFFFHILIGMITLKNDLLFSPSNLQGFSSSMIFKMMLSSSITPKVSIKNLGLYITSTGSPL